MKLKTNQADYEQSKPVMMTNGAPVEHKIAKTYIDQKITTKSSASSQYGTYGRTKKKASDHYFSGAGSSIIDKGQPRKQNDLLTREISPKKRSLERKNTYTKKEEVAAF